MNETERRKKIEKINDNNDDNSSIHSNNNNNNHRIEIYCTIARSATRLLNANQVGCQVLNRRSLSTKIPWRFFFTTITTTVKIEFDISHTGE